MSDPTGEFFDRLARHGHERVLEEATGTVRFDIEHDHGVDHWHVTVNRGDIRVSREKRDADCVVHIKKALFDRIACGEAFIYTAWLRNELTAEGDLRLGRLFQRVMPPSRSAHHPRAFVGMRRRI